MRDEEIEAVNAEHDNSEWCDSCREYIHENDWDDHQKGHELGSQWDHL